MTDEHVEIKSSPPMLTRSCVARNALAVLSSAGPARYAKDSALQIAFAEGIGESSEFEIYEVRTGDRLFEGQRFRF